MARVNPKWAGVVKDQHRKVDATVDHVVGKPMQQTYADTHASTMRGLSSRSRKGALTSADRSALQASVRASTPRLSTAVGSELRAGARTAAAESLQSLNAALRSMGVRTMTDMQIRAIVAKRAKMLADAQSKTMASVARDITANLQKKILESRADTVSELLAELDEYGAAEEWRIARLANTETSYAYNIVRADAIDAMDFQQRWTELVDDASGQPLDNRVGEDSLIMHGQLADAEGLFTMPEDEAEMAGGYMAGESWSCPPNRPNDRAILMPWAKGWGVPAWIMRGARRVEFR